MMSLSTLQRRTLEEKENMLLRALPTIIEVQDIKIVGTNVRGNIIAIKVRGNHTTMREPQKITISGSADVMIPETRSQGMTMMRNRKIKVLLSMAKIEGKEDLTAGGGAQPGPEIRVPALLRMLRVTRNPNRQNIKRDADNVRVIMYRAI